MANKIRTATQTQKEEWLSQILSHFLHITFTDAATKEMGERIAGKCLGRGYNIDMDMLPVLTFNAFDMDLLHKFYKDLDYLIQPTVVDVNPIRQVDKVLPLVTGDNQIKGLNYQIPVSMDMGTKGAQGALTLALNAFKIIKDKDITSGSALEDAMNDAGYRGKVSDDSAYDKLLEIYDEYEGILKTEGLITFADQEPIGIKLMDLHPDYLNKLGFWHVVIDEFQDSNDFNMEFVRRLQGCRDIHGGTIKSILVIGDSDQSIYAFRNAVVDNFNHFDRKIQENPLFKNDTIDHFNFVNNYRSTSNILDPSNTFVSNNKERVVKKLIAANGAGDPVVFKGFKSWDAELDYCIEEAKKVREAHPDWTICFMTRNKKNLANVSQALSKANQTWVMKAPMKISENTRVIAATNLFECFGDNESTQGIFDYLTVVSDNHFKDLPKDDQIQAIDEMRHSINELKSKNAFIQRQKMHELLDSLDKDDEIYMAWKDMMYQEALLGCQKEGSINNEPYWIYETIRKFKLYGQKTEMKMKRDYVADFILTTAHSSKGLEYDCVFVLMDDFDGFQYHRGAKDSVAIEEERRLIFVAMTRAKKKLYCTGSFVVYKNDFDGEVFNQFLRELYIARDGDTKDWEADCMVYRNERAHELEERRIRNNNNAKQRRADKKAAVMAQVLKGQFKLPL